MAKISKIHKARDVKNDEFYTQLTDIEKELSHYKHQFKDKIVLCNCDNPEWSEFWRYFHINFAVLGLKKLISTHYSDTERTYKLEYTGGNDTNIADGIKTELLQNGDFRSDECIELLKQADIVVTNPPFSLFREYVNVLMTYNKKFLIVASLIAIQYKEIFPLFKNKQVWLGYTAPKDFFQPDGSIKSNPTRWHTNLDVVKSYEKPVLWQKYDNYDALNVDKVASIPDDYDGLMGVPISFMDKYNPEEFEIVDIIKPKINGKKIFTRIIIRRK